MANMMSSRVLLSRFLPTAEGDVSVYGAPQRDTVRMADAESRRGRDMDGQFHDHDADPESLLFEATDQVPALRERDSSSPDMRPARRSPGPMPSRSRWWETQGKRRTDDDEDVPESLLLEPGAREGSRRPISRPSAEGTGARAEAQWRAAREQQEFHASRVSNYTMPGSSRAHPDQPIVQPVKSSPQSNAMWLYTNVSNLDAFLLEIYQYYVDHGVWSILLSRSVSLLTELFVFSFALFLSTCIDFSKIPTSKSTPEILIPKCMSKASWLKNATLFFFIVYWLSRLAHYIRDTRRLFQLQEFYLHVLGITDQDIQTVSWVQVVDGLVKVQNANIATANPPSQGKKYLDYKAPQQRLSPESIANRLMRQANYYVALYNKDIFDLTLPLPFVGNRQFYSKSLEWCIDFCLTNFIFDEQGSIRPFCLEVKNRSALVQALRMRLRFAAVTSVVIAPFNIVRFCIMYFFRYYTEFTRNPSRVSARTFTPFAEWKIREFNELDHLFQRRLRQAYPFANEYLKQFPKDKMDQICRFVAFISGAIAAVLALATMFDPELFLGFEVTPGRTAVFWLTIMVGVFGLAHGALPDENEVHDPVLHLKEVLLFTHYMPAHWKERLHSNDVRAEFSAMYQMKILIFVEEILSLIVAPWILWQNSGRRSERIIDFFREQTVHVEGIGYQCNFAVFGFKKDLNAEDPSAVLKDPDGLRDDYYGLKDDKMAASVQNFMQYYSHYSHRSNLRKPQGWQPPPAWPPVMSTPAIAEEVGGAPSFANARPGSTRRSGLLNRNIPSVRSPKQVATQRRTTLARRSEIRSNSDDNQREPAQGISESRIMAQDSDLQDFADAPGIMPLESDTDADDQEDHTTGNPAGGNAGVLGMLYQFSKAQTEKGATGGMNL